MNLLKRGDIKHSAFGTRRVPKAGTNAMDDKEIVKLFLSRDESAIKAASEKYGTYCMKIAESITGSREDAEECVNDVLMKAWETIPPNAPEMLSTYLGKFTRNVAINMRKRLLTDKRGNGEADLAYEELSELLRGRETVEEEFDRQELSRDINAFLETLPEHKRGIFVCRYWYCESVKKIAGEWGLSEAGVYVLLHRLRGRLKAFLRKRGHDI